MVPRVELIRLEEGVEGTFGVLMINGRLNCLTLEPPDKGNAPEISSIPEGEYRLAARRSPRFGDTCEVVDVPGRTDILVHPGNTVRDTHGCILLGTRIGTVGGTRGLLESRVAVERFLAALGPGACARLRVRGQYVEQRGDM